MYILYSHTNVSEITFVCFLFFLFVFLHSCDMNGVQAVPPGVTIVLLRWGEVKDEEQRSYLGGTHPHKAKKWSKGPNSASRLELAPTTGSSR